jgi:trehalose 6-phosphate phosphatase
MNAHALPKADPRWAWFLDVDGTLIEFAPRPQDVVVTARCRAALLTLTRETQGAVALISGRQLSALDGLFAPLRLAAAGVHGLERRNVVTGRCSVSRPSPALASVKRELEQFRVRHPKTLVEDKTVSVALHYRLASETADAAAAFANDIAHRYGDAIVVQPGSMVFEFRTPGADKGAAIASFLDEAPFAGRTPVFVGDDATDEVGFAEVNRRGGVSVKIGPGPSLARWRLSSPVALFDWLTAATVIIAP